MTLKAYFIVSLGFLSVFFSAAYAGNNDGPNLIVQEEENAFVMYLQVNNPEDFRSITIEGEIQQDNQTKSVAIEISEEQIPMLNDFVAKVHHISKEFQIASYSMSAVNLIGETLTFPEVTLDNVYAPSNEMAMLNK